MAEQLFASMSEFGMQLSTLTGAKGSLGNLMVKGALHPGSGSVPPRELKYNYVDKMVYNGTGHSTRRGLNLAIFDLNMNIVFMATYDTYGDTNAIGSLSAKMREITSSQIATLSTYDAMKSNQTLDDTFNYFRSNAWPGTAYLSSYSRTAYAAIICGKKKAIVAEKTIGGGADIDRTVEIEVAIDDPTGIGYSGFGTPVVSDELISENTGTSNIVKAWASATPLSTLRLKVGDSYMFKSLGETDAIAAAANTYLDYEILYLNSSGSEIGKQTRRVSSVEGWEEIEIRDKIPTGCDKITIQAARKTTREAPRSPQGSVYVKNTVMQLSDNDTAQATQVSIGVYGTSVKSYEDSLGSFGHYDPKGYFESAISESNIIRNTPLQQIANEPVRWMNKVLDDNIERVVMVTTQEAVSATVKFTIDPTKFYYACVWVNKQIKTSGEYCLGLREYSSSGSQLALTSTDGKTTDIWMHSQIPKFDDLETRQWYLVQGFILPHNVDRKKALDFIEANKEFYGWDDLYGNGIGVSDEGSGYYGWISHKDAKTGEIALIDRGNGGKESKSLWALPIVRELSIGSIDIDDGVITSMNLSG